MIPDFPKFKKLEFSDKADVEFFTNKYPPYSDFNFTSMWCWDTHSKMRISKLNSNLVVRFNDYLTKDKMFCSFFGNGDPTDTAVKLLDYAVKENLEPVLKYIPQFTIVGIDQDQVSVEEERDHFDYILDNRKLIDYKGRPLHNHANFKKRFTEIHGNNLDIKLLNMSNGNHKNHIDTLNQLWSKNKTIQGKEVISELEEKAIERIFDLGKESDSFIIVSIFHNDKMIGFTIDELLSGEYSIRHFMKADVAFKGVYSYLVSESAKYSLETGRTYVNIEQDLGLLGMRQAKKSFEPATLLKKYTIGYK
jgi:hypothetical protein